MTNPIEVAAIPTAISVLQAIKQFNINMGPDPAQWALKFPGSQLILLGTVQNLVPSLLVSEGGAVQTAANSQIDTWISKLQAQAPQS